MSPIPITKVIGIGLVSSLERNTLSFNMESMKVIIADDHGLVRAGIAQLLKLLPINFEIIEASNSREILAQAKNDIDLLLLDLGMPGIGNAKRVEQICAAMPSTAVVVVSGNESPHILKACMDAGAMGFIPKSSSSKVMQSAIQLILSGEQYVPYTSSQTTKHDSNYGKITPRQKEIWRLLTDGLSNKAIARELDLAEGTVKQHISALFKNLNIHNRVEAVKKAREIWG